MQCLNLFLRLKFSKIRCLVRHKIRNFNTKKLKTRRFINIQIKFQSNTSRKQKSRIKAKDLLILLVILVRGLKMKKNCFLKELYQFRILNSYERINLKKIKKISLMCNNWAMMRKEMNSVLFWNTLRMKK